MSDVPPPGVQDDDLPDMTAGELALGLLDGDARAVATRRVLAEPDFARAVAAWRERLADLFDLWPEMPAPDLFARIEQALFGGERAPQSVPERRPSKLWPGIAAFSSIAAAGLLVLLLTRPLPAPVAPSTPVAVRVATVMPTLVAAITPSAAGTPVTAVYDAESGALRLTEAKLARTRHDAELWVIPAGGTPHSLGLLHAQGLTALTLSPENRARIAAGATLAVSIEPTGGSPTGLPTGPVVATGALSRV